jgi:hypothetical protein
MPERGAKNVKRVMIGLLVTLFLVGVVRAAAYAQGLPGIEYLQSVPLDSLTMWKGDFVTKRIKNKCIIATPPKHVYRIKDRYRETMLQFEGTMRIYISHNALSQQPGWEVYPVYVWIQPANQEPGWGIYFYKITFMSGMENVQPPLQNGDEIYILATGDAGLAKSPGKPDLTYNLAILEGKAIANHCLEGDCILSLKALWRSGSLHATGPDTCIEVGAALEVKFTVDLVQAPLEWPQ